MMLKKMLAQTKQSSQKTLSEKGNSVQLTHRGTLQITNDKDEDDGSNHEDDVMDQYEIEQTKKA